VTATEATLLTRWIAERDAEAFNKLVSQYAGLVYGACRRVLGADVEAEDAAQECFLKMARLKKAPRGSLGAWLHTLATHAALDLLRGRTRRRRRERVYAEARTQNGRSEPTWADLEVHVDAAIAELPEKLRTVIVLHFIQRRTHEQIGTTLGASRQAVTRRIAKGVESLRRNLRRRGVGVTALLLPQLLAQRMTEAAPATLLGTLGKLALSGSASVPSSAPSVPFLLKLGGLSTGKKLLLSTALAAPLCLLGLLSFNLLRDRPGHNALTVVPPGDDLRPAAPAPATNASTPPPTVGEDRPGSGAAKTVDLGINVRGTVKSSTGEHLEGILVRWLPTSDDEVRASLYDGALLRQEPNLDLASVACRESFEHSLWTTTNIHGRYDLNVPRSAEVGVLIVSGTGYRTVVQNVPHPEKRSVPVEGDPVAPAKIEMNIELDPGGSISGQVVAATTGEAAGKMVIHALRVDLEAAPLMSLLDPRAPRTRVASDGSYLLRGIPPATYRVLARTGDSDYVSVRFVDGPIVTVEGGTEVTEVDFGVTRGGTIAGSVSTIDGSPLADAECTAIPAAMLNKALKGDIESFFANNTSRTDARGRFAIRGLSTGMSYSVTARSDGFAPSSTEPIDIDSLDTDAAVHLVLSPGRTISGRVFFHDGTPATRVDVSAVLGPNGGSLEIFAPRRDERAQTDSEGAFVIENLPDGRYTLVVGKRQASAGVGVPGEQTGKKVVVSGADVIGEVLIIGQKEPEALLSGTVENSEREPVKGATVTIFSASARPHASSAPTKTDDEGYFAASVPGKTPLYVVVGKKGYSSTVLFGLEPGSEMTITLDLAGFVSGKVLTADGVPLGPGGAVRVRMVHDNASGAGPESVLKHVIEHMIQQAAEEVVPIGSDSAFRVEVPTGKVQIGAVVPGFAPEWSDPIEIQSDDRIEGFELVISVGAVLQGLVVSGDGSIVAGANVAVTPKSSGLSSIADHVPDLAAVARMSVAADEHGRWEVVHLAPGEYSVVASHESHGPSETRMVVVARDENRQVLPLVLHPGTVIRGRIVEKGKPMEGLLVNLVGTGAPVQRHVTDQAGTFQFRGMPEGEYMLGFIARGAERLMKTQAVSVARGTETTLEVELGTGSRIHGKISGLPPKGNYMVILRRPGGPSPEEIDPLDPTEGLKAAKYQVGIAAVRADGTYEIRSVEPGRYILEALNFPKDPIDLRTIKDWDRTPAYRVEISVEGVDIEHSIDIR